MKTKLLIKSLQLFIPIILFSINVEAQELALNLQDIWQEY